jgi:hypothetical protein
MSAFQPPCTCNHAINWPSSRPCAAPFVENPRGLADWRADSCLRHLEIAFSGSPCVLSNVRLGNWHCSHFVMKWIFSALENTRRLSACRASFFRSTRPSTLLVLESLLVRAMMSARRVPKGNTDRPKCAAVLWDRVGGRISGNTRQTEVMKTRHGRGRRAQLCQFISGQSGTKEQNAPKIMFRGLWKNGPLGLKSKGPKSRLA